ncbi:hypothetical protein JKN65_09830 [Escherichia coli O157:H7]|uniref:hypothetical protein n=1 Tax=Escherichia coli TaxID=562 RepID=UPI001CF4FB10|nr:hypothetical protein JKN65_09830 [Escherichia coli O157:H7]
MGDDTGQHSAAVEASTAVVIDLHGSISLIQLNQPTEAAAEPTDSVLDSLRVRPDTSTGRMSSGLNSERRPFISGDWRYRPAQCVR